MTAFPLLTPRLTLRPFAPSDFEALLSLQSRPDVTRFLYWAPRSPEEVREALTQREQNTKIEAEGDQLSLAVLRRDTGAFVGDVTLHSFSAQHRSAELGFILHPDQHGQGLAGEASLELLRLGFEEFGLHRVIGRCDARNTPSARVMEKLGLRREAHFRQNEWVKGEWTDELVYAMLAGEWRGRESAAGTTS